MRAIDLFISFPNIIIALMIVVALKPGFGPLVLALTITGWTPYARLARAVGLEIATQTYIEAATATGESEFLIIRKHILPNTLGPILAQVFCAANGAGYSILAYMTMLAYWLLTPGEHLSKIVVYAR